MTLTVTSIEGGEPAPSGEKDIFTAGQIAALVSAAGSVNIPIAVFVGLAAHALVAGIGNGTVIIQHPGSSMEEAEADAEAKRAAASPAGCPCPRCTAAREAQGAAGGAIH